MVRFTTILLMAFWVQLLFPFSGYAQEDEELESLNVRIAYKQGQKAFQNKNFKKSIKYFNQVLKKDSSLVKTYFARGLSYLRMDSLDQAIRDFNTNISKEPTSKAYTYRAMARMRKKLFNNALNDFNKAIEMDTTNVQAFFNRGYLLQNLEVYEDAIKDFTEVIYLQNWPKAEQYYQRAYFYRGLCYKELGQNQKALRDLKKATRLNPNDAKAFYQKGLQHYAMDSIQQSIEAFDEALQINPRFIQAYYERGKAKGELDQLAGAIKDFTEYLKYNPKRSGAYQLRGLAYAKMGQNQKAYQDLQQAVKVNPKNANAYFLLGNVALRINKKQKACESWEKAKELGIDQANNLIIKHCSDF